MNKKQINSDTDNSTVVRGVGVVVEDEEGKGDQIYDDRNDNAIYR